MSSRQRPRLDFWACIGIIVGSLVWVIAYSILVLPKYGGLFAPYLFIAAVVSLTFAVMLILAMQLIRSVYANLKNAVFLSVFFGFTASFIGIIFLLITHWITPFLEQYPEKVWILRIKGIVINYKINDFISLFWLGIGLVLLLAGLVTLRRQKT